jgi:hypothetical protein
MKNFLIIVCYVLSVVFSIMMFSSAMEMLNAASDMENYMSVLPFLGIVGLWFLNSYIVKKIKNKLN